MDKYGLVFENCIKIQNNIWFSSGDYNGLYRYNLCNKSIERVMEFPNEKKSQGYLYYKVCKYQNKLIFIPCFANAISIYDIEDKKLEQIEIPYLGQPHKVHQDFMEGTVYQDSLYIIGYAYPGIIKVNLETYEIKKIYEIQEGTVNPESVFFGSKIDVEDNLLYIPCCYKNAVLVYDMNLDKVSYINNIGNESNRYTQIVKDNQKLYLITKNSNLVFVWDEKKQIFTELDVKFKKMYRDALLRISEEYVWAISIIAGEIYQINKSNYNVRSIEFQQKLGIEYVATSREGIFLLDGYTANWYFVDNNGKIIDLKIKIEEPRSKEELWTELDESTMKLEDKIWTLHFLVFRVLRKKNIFKKEDVMDKTKGKRIWNNLQNM